MTVSNDQDCAESCLAESPGRTSILATLSTTSTPSRPEAASITVVHPHDVVVPYADSLPGASWTKDEPRAPDVPTHVMISTFRI